MVRLHATALSIKVLQLFVRQRKIACSYFDGRMEAGSKLVFHTGVVVVAYALSVAAVAQIPQRLIRKILRMPIVTQLSE